MLLGLIKESKRHLIVGFLSLVLSIVFMFDIKPEYGNVNITNLALGLLIFLSVFTLMMPHFRNSRFMIKFIIFLEIIASQYVAVTYFLIPAFDSSIIIVYGNPSDWISLMLMGHAIIHLLILYRSKEEKRTIIFMIYLILLMTSVFIYNKDFLDVQHNYFLTIGFLGHTVLSVYYLFFDKQMKRKHEKDALDFIDIEKEV